jgi:Protein kinase domain
MHLQVATSGEAVGGSRYRTLGRLGSGGMAEVDLALQTGVAGSSRLCVLKRVRRDLAARQEFVSMFFEEARISASLSHPNIVQIYEVGGDEQDCFLAMELLRGRSYAHLQRVNSEQPLGYRIELEVLLATLAALEHAHQRRDLSGAPMQLVHRDISPPNVVITYDGEIKLLDFGVAKSRHSLVNTEAGILKGKVAYMAPEVVAGDPFDARADLYAVGVMLWEATAGGDRWPGMSDVAILAQLARGGAVESPGAAARGLPASADAVCIKSLAEEPDARYQSAAEFRDALLALCEALGGRLGQAEIKAYMARYFAAEQLREDREIEAALREQRITPGSAQPGDAEVSGFTKQVKRSSERPPALRPATTEAPKSRGRLWAALAVLLLGGAVLAKLLAPSQAPEVARSAQNPGDKPALATPPVASAPLAMPVAAEAVPEAPAAAAAVKPSHAVREHGKAVPARAATADAALPEKKPAPARSLQLDRQDPWQ